MKFHNTYQIEQEDSFQEILIRFDSNYQLLWLIESLDSDSAYQGIS